MLNRVRLEASGATEKDVELHLLSAASSLKADVGGEWEEEYPLEVQSTKNGFWGRWTLKLKEGSRGKW